MSAPARAPFPQPRTSAVLFVAYCLAALLTLAAAPGRALPPGAAPISPGDILVLDGVPDGEGTVARHRLVRVDPIDGTTTIVSEGGALDTQAWWPGFDASASTAYASDYATLTAIDLDTGTQHTLLEADPALEELIGALRVDEDGTLLFVVFLPSGINELRRLDPATGVVTTLVGAPPNQPNTIGTPWGLAFDGAGGLYLGDYDWGFVYRADPVAGTSAVAVEPGNWAGVPLFDIEYHAATDSVLATVWTDAIVGIPLDGGPRFPFAAPVANGQLGHIAVAADDSVIAAYALAGGLYRIAADGQSAALLPTPELGLPREVAIVPGAVPACRNGLDDDGDGFADYPDDPGCRSSHNDIEAPACDDDQDNDNDGYVDWDGGASGALPDPECDAPHRRNERGLRCGLGFEAGFAALLACVRRRRRA